MPFMNRYDPFSPTFAHPLLNSSPDYGARNGTFSNRPIGGFGGQMSFRERNKRLRDLDDEKNQLIEDLLYQLENTQEQLRKLQLDQRTQQSKDFQLREKALQDQLQQTKEIMDRNAFLLALIDGDGTIFTKDLLTKGEKGGKEAATLLAAVMNDLANDRFPHLESPKIVLRICADLSTLSDKLVKSKVIEKTSTLDEFIRGFNNSKPLFDFVDAGNKKDAAGNKLCELLRLNLYDCHCHQVLFGCSHNNDYAHILEEVLKDEQVIDHLTLLQGVPFEKDLVELQSQFHTTKFDHIFSSVRLTVPIVVPKGAPTVAAALPVLSRVESNKTNANSSNSSTPALNWATVTAQAQLPPPPSALKPLAHSTNGTNSTNDSAVKRVPTPSSSAKTASSKLVKVKTMERNRLGQRIDKTDTTIPNYEIQRVKKLKLCNVYYLQSPDLCTSSNCSHRHDYPISNHERKTLREVARMTPCYYKTECDDADCIYGHRCPQSKQGESGCYYGEDCRFYGWGHGIDTRSCSTVKV